MKRGPSISTERLEEGTCLNERPVAGDAGPHIGTSRSCRELTDKAAEYAVAAIEAC